VKQKGSLPSIQYISHGASETGGYAHEFFFAQSLSETLTGNISNFQAIRFRRNFKGVFAWLWLALKTFISTDRNAVVITVSRLAWPVRLKLLFGEGKLLLVLHNYDPSDGKPYLYYRLLDLFLKHAAKNPSRIFLVVDATYWQRFFNGRFLLSSVFFPNFFDANTLHIIRDSAKKNQKLIHFGMFSEKADLKKYLVLYHIFKQRGFVCYFSSPTPVFSPNLPVSVFQNRGDYLKQVAGSAATIIINKIHEGWNRLAHESILLGTPVIASPGGGLEDLVRLSGGVICEDPETIVQLIETGLPPIVFDNNAFEPANKQHYLEKIISFIQH
jgi:glycosyltransferase involved in cell wall biosynthesis